MLHSYVFNLGTCSWGQKLFPRCYYGTQILCKILCMGGTERITGTRVAFVLF